MTLMIVCLFSFLDVYECALGIKKKYHSQNLTGGLDGGQYLTDITNGQITGMFNLETNNWDPELCR